MRALLTMLCAYIPFCGGPIKAAYTVSEGIESVFDIPLTTASAEQSRSLASFKGNVVLIVNTASKCGFTQQYAGLEELHKRYQGRGFSVLGFPSNDFAEQEPGTDAEIATFCTKKFGVTFPLFPKSHVTGDAISPVFAFLTARAPEALKGKIKWNFEKFLVDRNGHPIARFGSFTGPSNPALVKAIEEALR